MSPQPYNFRKPGRLALDLEQSLAAWLRGVCTLAPDKWAKELPFRLEMSVHSLDIVPPGDALARLAETDLSYRLLLGTDAVPTLLTLPRQLVLVLVNGMLGDGGAALPSDRELSVVEMSLCEYLLQVLFVAVIQETWPGLEPVPLQVGQQEPRPKFARIFPPDENIVVCAFALRGPFGEQPWHWMLPRKGLQEQLDRAGHVTGAEQMELVRPRLENVVRELPVEVAVSLGAVELPLSQLAKLRAGDIVILDQRVSDPLTVCVAGEKKFRVWPGRVGSRQAFQIDSVLEC